MTREEFLQKVNVLTTQLNNLVDELPNIPALEESDDNVEESKLMILSAILNVEMDSEELSTLYFDQD